MWSCTESARHTPSSPTRERRLLLLRQRLAAVHQVAARALRAGNVGQTARVENANRIRRPRRAEVQTRTHLREILLLVGRLQKRVVSKAGSIVALTQQPSQNLAWERGDGSYGLLLLRELRSDLDVVAKLRFNLLDLRRNRLSGFSQQTVRRCLRQTRGTKVVNNNFSTQWKDSRVSYAIVQCQEGE